MSVVAVAAAMTVSSSVCVNVSRSPLWSSGYPRMLPALVLKFGSHRGDILTLFAKMQKKRINC